MNKFLSDRTMVNKLGRRQFEEAIKIVIEEKINGDFVQCGVWRGGLAGLVLSYIKEHSLDKKIWLYDTFLGMPAPSEKDCERSRNEYNLLKDEDSEFSNWCKASTEDVIETLESVSMNFQNSVNFVVGKVEDTLLDEDNLPKAISMLHLDTDWYDSIKIELEVLFPRMSPGAFLIIDDYKSDKEIPKGWDGCTDAVNDFFAEKNIELHPLVGFEHEKILTLRKKI